MQLEVPPRAAAELRKDEKDTSAASIKERLLLLYIFQRFSSPYKQ